jgi:hypothetical protein
MLELFANGRHSLTALQRELAAAGIVGGRSNKPLPLSSIGNILRNPFYYGLFAHKGELHQGTHVPMISKKTFDEIQVAYGALAKPRGRRQDKGFLFLDFATCGSCGYAITGERHVKKSGRRYHYYRCTHKNKKQHCDDRSFIREEKFMEEVKRNAGLATIPDEWKERFLARIETWEAEASEAKQQKIDRLTTELAALKAKINRINDAFADGSLDIAEFKRTQKPPCAPQGRIGAGNHRLGKEQSKSARTLEKLDFGGKQGGKSGFREQLVRNEVIPSKSWLEPPFALSNLNRFLHNSLVFIG